MRPVKAIGRGFKGYFTIKGRSNRKDFWWWLLFVLIMLYVGSVIDNEYINPVLDFLPGEDGAPDYCVWAIFIVLIIPTITMAIRRAHDHGKPGWYALLIFPLLTSGNKKENKYGPKV